VNEVFLSTGSFGQVHQVHTNGAVSRESVRLADPTLHLNRWLDLHSVTDRQSITPRQPSFGMAACNQSPGVSDEMAETFLGEFFCCLSGQNETSDRNNGRRLIYPTVSKEGLMNKKKMRHSRPTARNNWRMIETNKKVAH
jgi:hypothetical protein